MKNRLEPGESAELLHFALPEPAASAVLQGAPVEVRHTPPLQDPANSNHYSREAHFYVAGRLVATLAYEWDLEPETWYKRLMRRLRRQAERKTDLRVEFKFGHPPP